MGFEPILIPFTRRGTYDQVLPHIQYIALTGFEPVPSGPEPDALDLYATGLYGICSH